MILGTCRTCRLWNADFEFRDIHRGWLAADCRRHSPNVLEPNTSRAEYEYGAQWPQTKPDDWCGDWQEHPQAHELSHD